MIGSIIKYLLESGLFTGYGFTDWRDDTIIPFKDNDPAVLIRIQGGLKDKDIGNVGVDLYIHTEKNADNVKRMDLMSVTESITEWMNYNYKFGRFYGVRIIDQGAGPFKDAQNRYFTVIRIQLLRNSGIVE